MKGARRVPCEVKRCIVYCPFHHEEEEEKEKEKEEEKYASAAAAAI